MNGMIFGQGGFDTKGKTIQAGRYMGNSTSFVDLINVYGSGYLLSVAANTTDAIYYSVRIVIDGVEKFNGPVGHGYTSFSISPLISFKTSCLVQVKADTSGYMCGSAIIALN